MRWRPRLRVRLTVRSTMVLIAMVAVGMVALIPIGRALIWQYRTPWSVNLFTGAVVEHQILGTRTRSGSPGQVPPRFPVGVPAAAVCTYECGSLPILPAGLPFRVSSEAILMDTSRTPWVPIETRSHSAWLISGVAGWDRAHGVFACELTPRGVGPQTVRYQVVVTDLFGRRATVALHTGGFKAE